MGNSLGDFNILQSSSVDVKNIKWTQKKSRDMDKPKKKKARKICSTNVIYTTKIKIKTAKTFKIKENNNVIRKKTDKKFQSSSASTCKIKQGFSRPGR